MNRYHVVIVGAGHGGAQTAIQLRQLKYKGSILIIGDELEPPYERPPLSKEYLTREKAFERILIRPRGYWAERGITLRLGSMVNAIDPATQTVTTNDGEVNGYEHLVWATGGSPRRLTCAGHGLAGLHTVRTHADVDRIVEELPAVEQVVVIGGGYIGLESAAALAKVGKRVVLLEALDRVLSRVAGEQLSRFLEAEHRNHGVDVRLGAKVNCVLGDERVTGVRLTDGTVFNAQMVIVGIGIVPAVEPLLAAGASGGNGVTIDAQCRTSLPHVFAVGDCALHENGFADGAPIRLESVQNANDQAAVVAKTITGQLVTYEAMPWFWSNQYDIKLQTVGLSMTHDMTVVRGELSSKSFSIIYVKGGKVVALDCINAVKDYVQGGRLIERGSLADIRALADTKSPLKDLIS